MNLLEYSDNIVPLEEREPAVAEFLKQVAHQKHETVKSCFLSSCGNVYLDKRGQRINLKPTISAGRNDPCPCGSGKKFKKCCG